MNVEDVTAMPGGDAIPEDRLEAIFHYHRKLVDKYSDIERRNGLGRGLLPETFDVDDPRCQYVMKDFAWRVVEEVGEALDALSRCESTHAYEELADGFHFLVELCEMIGIEAEAFPHYSGLDRLGTLFLPVPQSPSLRQLIKSLGMAMNCLKNKPWKQTHFSTDEANLRSNVMSAVRAYVMFAHSQGMSSAALFDMYFRKNQVNHFRIESGY